LTPFAVTNPRVYIISNIGLIFDISLFHLFRFEYNKIGVATEFRFANEIGKAFRGNTKLMYLQNFGVSWGFLNSTDALVFVDNHDNQRSNGKFILTYKNSKQYKMATAFAAAFPYGHLRLMSSFAFSDIDHGNRLCDNTNQYETNFIFYIQVHQRQKMEISFRPP
jgi:hypothetical protein